MCNIGQALGIAPKPVDTAAIERKAKADAEAAAASATQATNAKMATRNRSRNLSLLATGAGDTGALQTSTGKTTLGA
jgi:hypothetical protein